MTAGRDIIQTLGDKLRDFGGWFPQHEFLFAVHLAIALTLGTWGCLITHRHGCRSKTVQIIILTICLVLSSSIPADKISVSNPIIRAWILILCAMDIVVIPFVLPRYVISEAGKQPEMTSNIYFVIVILFIANLVIR